MKKGKRKKWEWFCVKLVFENIISGKPEPDTIDKNYTNNYKTFEESIILVKAQSFEHAYKIADKRASRMGMDYLNPYGELVNWKLVEAIDCYRIGDEKLSTRIEVYSRCIRVDRNTKTEDFLDKYYPDTIEDRSGVFLNAVLLNTDFTRSCTPNQN